jgi:site-specific DNA-methyltransferase (adenine-specific)
MKIEPNNCYNIDCEIGMKLMKEQGLKADWCITDPPYGIGYTSMTGGGDNACKCREYTAKSWDNIRIETELINLMRESSNNQIIFGGNYYTDVLPPTKSWIVWNKRSNDMKNDFADCELAWCSKGVARVFNYMYNGMLQDDMRNKDERFHPTQKPTQLWCKLLNYYTKENDLILDPFAGSQSLRIACYKLKRRYIGFEIDKEYYEKGCEWYKKVIQQVSMFDLM